MVPDHTASQGQSARQSKLYPSFPLQLALRYMGLDDGRMVMHSPYGIEIVEDCLSRKLCSEGFFCRLPKSVMEAFQSLKFTLVHPAGATLFVEGQVCRGIYIPCRGRVKQSTSSKEGQTLILKAAQPGEVLGLSATVLAASGAMAALSNIATCGPAV